MQKYRTKTQQKSPKYSVCCRKNQRLSLRNSSYTNNSLFNFLLRYNLYTENCTLKLSEHW